MRVPGSRGVVDALCVVVCVAMADCGTTKPVTQRPTAPPGAPPPSATTAQRAPAPPSAAEQKANQADALRKRGVLDRAAQLYGEACALEKRPEWLLTRAHLLAEAWAFKDAAKAYASLLELPGLPKDTTARAEEALADAKTRAASPPAKLTDEQAEKVDAQVRDLLLKKRFAQARAVLGKVVSGPQKDLARVDELAVLYWREGNTVEAQKTWSRGRSALPADEADHLDFELMPPFKTWTQVMALGNEEAVTESIDRGLVVYNYLEHRFLGEDNEMSEPRQVVFGKGAGGSQRAARNSGRLHVHGGTPVDFEAFLERRPPGHEPEQFSSMALSPDGEWIAWGATDGGVRVDSLYRADEAKLLPETAALRKLGAVRSLAYNPDGKRIAAGYAKGAIRLLTNKGREIGRLLGHSGSVEALSFAPGGKRLFSGSLDGSVRLWDVAGRKELARLHQSSRVFYVRGRGPSEVDFGNGFGLYRSKLPPEGKPRELISGSVRNLDLQAVSDSPDGRTRATVHFKSDAVELWDPATGAHIDEIRADNEKVSDIALSPHRRWLAVAGDNVHLLDLVKLVHHTFPFKSVHSVAFSPDGKLLAAAGFDGRVVLWNPSTRKQKRQIAAPDKGYAIDKLRFSTDGRFIAATVRGKAELFDVATGEPSNRLHGMADFAYVSGRVAVTNTPKNSSGPNDKLSVFDRSIGGRPRYVVEGAAPLAIASSSKWLAARDNSDAVVWDDKGNEKLRMRADELRLVALSPSGNSLALAEGYGRLQVVDTSSKRVGMDFIAHRGLFGITAVKWVAGGNVLVTSGTDGIKFWNPAAGSEHLLAQLRVTSDGWYLVTPSQASDGGSPALTAGYSRAIVSDVVTGYLSGGFLWEARRNDAVLGNLFRCGQALCGGAGRTQH